MTGFSDYGSDDECVRTERVQRMDRWINSLDYWEASHIASDKCHEYKVKEYNAPEAVQKRTDLFLAIRKELAQMQGPILGTFENRLNVAQERGRRQARLGWQHGMNRTNNN
jgi:hypothetical protein